MVTTEEIEKIIHWYINNHINEFPIDYYIDEVSRTSDTDSERFSILFRISPQKTHFINWTEIQEYFREKNLKKLGI